MADRMSFLSIFKNIGKGLLAVEKVAAPIAEGLLPAYAPLIMSIDHLFGTTQAAIVTAEQNNPLQNGQLKLDAVTNDFNAALSELQSILAVTGKQLTYDGNGLTTAINAQVAAYNAFAALKSTFKIADAPAPAAVTPVAPAQ